MIVRLDNACVTSAEQHDLCNVILPLPPHHNKHAAPIARSHLILFTTMNQLPPSFTDGPHMDVMMDDMLSRDLAAPREKQRRHIAGHTGNIDEAIRPMDDRERRQLHAREMHEFTAVRRRGRDIAPLAVSPIDHTPSLRVHAHTARGVVLGRCSDQGNSSIPQRQRRNTAV